MRSREIKFWLVWALVVAAFGGVGLVPPGAPSAAPCLGELLDLGTAAGQTAQRRFDLSHGVGDQPHRLHEGDAAAHRPKADHTGERPVGSGGGLVVPCQLGPGALPAGSARRAEGNHLSAAPRLAAAGDAGEKGIHAKGALE